MTRTITRFLTLILMLLALGTINAQAQTASKKPTKMVSVPGKAVVKTRGADPHIKTGVPTTDKAETKSRGDICGVKFDNYTGLTILLYVDGNYKGTVGPYGDSRVYVGSGYTTIYCISAGGTREWNAEGNCDDMYVYTLR